MGICYTPRGSQLQPVWDHCSASPVNPHSGRRIPHRPPTASWASATAASYLGKGTPNSRAGALRAGVLSTVLDQQCTSLGAWEKFRPSCPRQTSLGDSGVGPGQLCVKEPPPRDSHTPQVLRTKPHKVQALSSVRI